jgi:RimJ/RimL family protein N-acetyltransferase
MNLIPIITQRLELIPITVELCKADLSSHQELGNLLCARIPGAWPPEQVTNETIQTFISLLQAQGGSRFLAYYWIKKPCGFPYGERTLIGSGGFIIGEDNVPELGYSVLEEFQGKGYASEAAREMIRFMFEDPGVSTIQACTYPNLISSIRVLEKNGFEFSGPGKETGTISYYLSR